MHLIVYDLVSSNADFVFLLGDVGVFFFFSLGLIIEFETLENMNFWCYMILWNGLLDLVQGLVQIDKATKA